METSDLSAGWSSTARVSLRNSPPPSAMLLAEAWRICLDHLATAFLTINEGINSRHQSLAGGQRRAISLERRSRLGPLGFTTSCRPLRVTVLDALRNLK